MKKIIAAILAVMMIAAMSTTAFAAEGTGTLKEGENSKSIDVTAKYTEGLDTVNTVSANISWGAMEFTYHVGGTKTWNPETHKYDVTDTSGEWKVEGNTVTVENHSDIAIKVNFAYAKAEGFDGITGTLTVAEDTLDAHPMAADPTSTAAADKVETELTLSGTLANTVTNFTKVGTITVTIGE